MLRELSDVQEDADDEEVWGCAEVSFIITTRANDADEIIERKYRFSHAPEWDKWTLKELDEKKRESAMDTWRRSRNVTWDDPDEVSMEAPESVKEKLEELLNVDTVTIQG
jgi:hypothetical protein